MNCLKELFVKFLVVCFFSLSVMQVYADVNKKQTSNLPSPAALFEKHIQAVGGKKTIQSNNSKTFKGTMNIAAMGVSGELHVVASAPNRIVTNVRIAQLNMVTSEGFNGTLAWKIDPMAGNKILEGGALAAVKDKSDFYADNLNLGKNTAKQETIDLVEVDGEKQYKVLLVNKNGSESFLYFSKETGLLKGTESMESTAYGILPTVLRIKSYAEVEGMKVANHLVVTQGGVETVIKFESVSFAPVAENAFDLPKEIQSLVK